MARHVLQQRRRQVAIGAHAARELLVAQVDAGRVVAEQHHGVLDVGDVDLRHQRQQPVFPAQRLDAGGRRGRRARIDPGRDADADAGARQRSPGQRASGRRRSAGRSRRGAAPYRAEHHAVGGDQLQAAAAEPASATGSPLLDVDLDRRRQLRGGASRRRSTASRAGGAAPRRDRRGRCSGRRASATREQDVGRPQVAMALTATWLMRSAGAAVTSANARAGRVGDQQHDQRPLHQRPDQRRPAPRRLARRLDARRA